MTPSHPISGRWRWIALHAFALCALLCGLPGLASGQEADTDARLDRNQITEGQSVTLTIILPDAVTDLPDLAALEQDFDILSRSQSTHTRIINNRMSRERELRLELLPLRSGELRVPALDLGGYRTPALSLTVTPASSASTPDQGAPEVFLEAEISDANPYVQAQVTYTVRLFHRVNLADAALFDPELPDALIERLGEDRRGRAERHGQTYQYVERRYALFPQRSGSQQIRGPRLEARIADGPGGFPSLGSLFGNVRSLRLRADTQTLTVRAAPADFPGQWLPAQTLQLSEQWEPDSATAAPGAPLTRQITLRARGLTAAQLPDPQAREATGLKAYPDPVVPRDLGTAADWEGSKTRRIALLAAQPGSYRLPPLRIPWWDLTTDQLRYAELPAREVTIIAPAGSPDADSGPGTSTTEPGAEPATGQASDTAPAAHHGTPPPTAAGAPASPLHGTARPPAAGAPAGAHGVPEQPPASTAEPPRPNNWPWASLLLLLGWLGTLVLWWLDRRALRGLLRQDGHPAAAAGQARSVTVADLGAIRRACAAQDPVQTRRALLAWTAQSLPGLAGERQTLRDRITDPAARQALTDLEAAIFGPQGTQQPWDGQAAWQALEPALVALSRSPTRACRKGGDLPPLYPAAAAS